MDIHLEPIFFQTSFYGNQPDCTLVLSLVLSSRLVFHSKVIEGQKCHPRKHGIGPLAAKQDLRQLSFTKRGALVATCQPWFFAGEKQWGGKKTTKTMEKKKSEAL